MKVSAITEVPTEEEYQRRNLFIKMSNSFMSSPEVENPVEKTGEACRKPSKLGIENIQEFTIFPRQVIDGRTVITA